MSKYTMIKPDPNRDEECVIIDMETRKYFNGYDFMGSVCWTPSVVGCVHFDYIADAKQVIADLESADTPCEPGTTVEPQETMPRVATFVKTVSTGYLGQMKLSKEGKWTTVTNECEKQNLAKAQINRLLETFKTPPVGIRIIKVTTTYEVV